MKTVFVSGATGFLGAHVVEQALGAGHRVRGSVRSLARTEATSFLRDLPGASERLELVEADLNDPVSFEPHVDGCDTVLHVASPYALDVQDPQRDLVDPAVGGTRGVLEACTRTSSVRRVVLTSSMAAITDEPPDRVLTEDDWNQSSSLDRNPYYFSKTLAERAAWAFVTERVPRWDLVAINPFLVMGPAHTRTLNVSNKVIADLITGVYPGILRLAWGLVGVRDVAYAHLRAMEVPGARGRYICAGGVRSMRELVESIAARGYRGARLPRLPLDNPAGDWIVRLGSRLQPAGVGQYLRSHVGRVPRFDNARIQRDLGVSFRPIDQTIADTLADLVRWGHVPPPGA